MEFEGIVTSVTAYRESDGIVNLLTKNGFVTFTAHGILKINAKLTSLCQLYNVVKVDLSQNKKSSHYTLQSGETLKSYKNLYENIEAMLTLGFIIELAKKTIDEENISSIYEAILVCLDAILMQKDLRTIRLAFLSHIINNVGLTLNVNECVRCGSKKGIISLSYFDGGFVCHKCLLSTDIQHKPLYIKMARYVMIAPLKEVVEKALPEFECNALFRDFYHFLSEQLDIKLKNFELLVKIL